MCHNYLGSMKLEKSLDKSAEITTGDTTTWKGIIPYNAGGTQIIELNKSILIIIIIRQQLAIKITIDIIK